MEAFSRAFTAEAFGIFVEAIYVTIKGMAGIFVFMLLFYSLVKILSYIFKEEAES